MVLGDGPDEKNVEELTYFITAMSEAIEKNDKPATIFGLAVNRKLITTLSLSALASLAPWIISLAQSLQEKE